MHSFQRIKYMKKLKNNILFLITKIFNNNYKNIAINQYKNLKINPH